jgi:hypothetical protein
VHFACEAYNNGLDALQYMRESRSALRRNSYLFVALSAFVLTRTCGRLFVRCCICLRAVVARPLVSPLLLLRPMADLAASVLLSSLLLLPSGCHSLISLPLVSPPLLGVIADVLVRAVEHKEFAALVRDRRDGYTLVQIVLDNYFERV